MKILCVIPARYASTRLPGKPLADIAGKPMICRVYERASEAECIAETLVATDDQRVYDAVKAEGGKAMMFARFHHGICRRIDYIGVIAEPARHTVGPGTAVEAVIAVAAQERVIAGHTEQRVVPNKAREVVCAGVAGQRIGKSIAGAVDCGRSGERQVFDLRSERQRN